MSSDLAALRASVEAEKKSTPLRFPKDTANQWEQGWNGGFTKALDWVLERIDSLELAATTAAAKEDAVLLEDVRIIERRAGFHLRSHGKEDMSNTFAEDVVIRLGELRKTLETKQKENEPPKRKGGYGLEMTLARNQKKEREGNDKIEVEFGGEVAEKIKAMGKQSGQDVGTILSGAVSILSSVGELADRNGMVTVVKDGNYYKIKVPTK